jgi:hypothetical protein
MHEPAPPPDVKTLWLDQPEEEASVVSPENLDSRTTYLFATTRSEIAMGLGAALFFACIVAWRMSLDLLVGTSLALLAIWILVTLFRLRKGLWSSPKPSGAVAFTASGIEFYRSQLERRHKHLKNAWLWYGPLLLACITLTAAGFSTAPGIFRLLQRVWPLLLVLLVWTAFSSRRRHKQAEEIRQEIDDLAGL